MWPKIHHFSPIFAMMTWLQNSNGKATKQYDRITSKIIKSLYIDFFN